MIRKLRGIKLGAAEGDGETSAAATTDTPAVTPKTPKMPKTPTTPRKRKTEDETEEAKPKTAHKTKVSRKLMEKFGEAKTTEEW
ncbi:hypothetical protein H2201_005117 [Coniosporium apollinis]|uniref:Uncharacterized protein n=1 Tax=Coniosporium apollinis TaxID=61459 RepID=A0ABQ9NX89_9PEZI|nr:hypothetical protein H2201_005117 [Coniosporium apollinis]